MLLAKTVPSRIIGSKTLSKSIKLVVSEDARGNNKAEHVWEERVLACEAGLAANKEAW